MGIAMRCREILADDFDDVARALARGFPGRTERDWMRSLRLLAEHNTPEGYPKFGYLLEDNSLVVGVILLIFTDIVHCGRSHVRCNVSSWFVEPEYRTFAGSFSQRALKRQNVTYFNVSPAPHTWDMLRLHGFETFATGRTIALPMFSRSVRGVSIKAFSSEDQTRLLPHEFALLQSHQGYGCICFIAAWKGKSYPFVFGVDKRRGWLRVAHLVYARDIRHFVKFSGAIGRFLAKHGCFIVKFHTNRQIKGILGKHFEGHPKFRRGGSAINRHDVAYSEQVLFGY